MAKQKTTVGPKATPEGRLSFPHLDQPNTGGNYPSGKYEGTLLMPNTSNFDTLRSMCLEAARLQWPDLNLAATDLRLPFRDGNEKSMDGYANTIYIKAKTKNKPLIVGPDRGDYVGPIKAGDFVRFSVTADGYKMNLQREVAEALQAAGKRVVSGRDERGQQVWWRPAVTLYLNSVQWLREGPAFGGTSGVQAFEDDAPAASPADDALFR